MKRNVLIPFFKLFSFLVLFNISQIQASVLSARIEFNKTSPTIIEAHYIITVTSDQTNFDSSALSAKIRCDASSLSADVKSIRLLNINKNISHCPKTLNLVEYHFSKTIDFSDPAYSSLNSCGDLRLTLSVKGRANNNNLKNDEHSDVYVWTEFKHNGPLANNNSMDVRNSTVFVAGLNQAFYGNFGMMDIQEYDSLSFRLVPVMKNGLDILLNETDFYPDKPVSVFYPPSTSYPYSNGNARPPIGFSFDPFTGEVLLTPTKEEQGAFAILATEWRKDGKGQYQQVGQMHIESNIVIDGTAANVVPSIELPKNVNLNVCEGQTICFDVFSFDQDVPGQDDTVAMWWNRGIPNASFTILDPNAKLPTGRFCWTPTASDVQSEPHKFKVNVRDQFCPNAGMSQLEIPIYVVPEIKAKLQIERLSKARYEIKAEDPNMNSLRYSRRFRLLYAQDSSPVLDNSIAQFKSTKDVISTQDDELELFQEGEYLVEATLSVGTSCSDITYHPIYWSVVGIQDQTTNHNILVYPNPTQNKVRFDRVVEKIQVYTHDGRLTLQFRNQEEVDLAALSGGIYTLKLLNQGYWHTQKLIISH